ncbi:MAG: insulinase family protein [Deltaproteobacteria bacterium]|nr:insulinase family protein [Deltaproteobacteria bacterium]
MKSAPETVDLFRSWKVSRYRFDNGLRVLLLPDPSTPLISYHTWYRVGSRNEVEGKTGLAHLFEHLMFGATSNHPSGEFDRELERMGAETNAATWLDWTYYHQTFPPDALELVLEFESDRMHNLVLTDEVVTREKSVVANERRYRVEDRVDGFLDELLYKTAFEVHTYGHPTIGWMDDIENFTLDDCLDFYRTYYSPGNAIVVVVGRFEADEMLARLELRFGSTAAQVVPPLEIGEEPEQKGEKRIEVSREMPAAKLLAGYHVPGIGDPMNAALVVLNTILSGGESGRLVRRLVHDTEVATDLMGWTGVFADPCLLEFQVDLREGRQPEEALRVLDEELEKVLADGVSEEEIGTARNRNRLAFYMGLGMASGKANQLGFFETVLDDCGALTRRIQEIERVGRGEVLEAARSIFRPQNRTIILATPEKS